MLIGFFGLMPTKNSHKPPWPLFLVLLRHTLSLRAFTFHRLTYGPIASITVSTASLEDQNFSGFGRTGPSLCTTKLLGACTRNNFHRRPTKILPRLNAPTSQ